MITHLFAARITGRMDEQCPAIQSAIDRVAEAWGSDRLRMVEVLQTTFPADMLHNDIMNGWATDALKLATGMDRREWLAHFT